VADAGRTKWSLTQAAFDRLLDSLGPDRDAAAGRYLEIRRNLVRLFEWRGCATPDEYADETLNRCARKVGDGDEIRDLATYSIGVARMLLREMSRDRSREARPLDEAPEPRTLPAEAPDESAAHIECLRRCLAELSPANRDLILNYYQGESADPSWAPVARYAWGRDYHDVIAPRLDRLGAYLEEACGARSRGYVDTGPVLERDLAARAGLGWIGKNTMLLRPGLGR